MFRARGLLCGVLLALVVSLCSCSGSGVSSSVYMPECVSSTRVVGVAPIAVDDVMLSYCVETRSIALEALLREAETSAAFSVVAPEILLAHSDGGDSLDAEALLTAAEQLSLDGVLFCSFRGRESTFTTTKSTGWGLAYNSSDGLSVTRGKEDVTETTWSGADVTLQIVQVPSGDVIAESRFDRSGHQKDGWWWRAPPAREAVVDIIEYIFKPIADAWTR